MKLRVASFFIFLLVYGNIRLFGAVIFQLEKEARHTTLE